MSSMRELLQLQNVLPMKYSPVLGKKLNIALKYVMPLMVHRLRSNEHIRNLMKCSVWKSNNLSCTFSDHSHIIFYFTDIYGWTHYI
jgi:hypothetical protein